MKNIINICNLDCVLADKFLRDACERVYNTIAKSDKPMVESQLARELLSPLLGANTNLHGPYLRTALDILTSEGFVKKEGAKYSLE